jgi:flavodoxin
MQLATSPQVCVAIVCESVHRGNTRRIAEGMAEVLQADVFTPAEITPAQLSAYGLIGFGSGIYYGRHHRSIRVLADNVPREPHTAFLFSTAGLPFLSHLWHSSVRRRLRRRGWRVAGEFTCRGWDRWGPLVLVGGLNRHHPDERDRERAREFARTLVPGT